eukprot:8485158-Alexandrium_andersonii.AAC.1
MSASLVGSEMCIRDRRRHCNDIATTSLRQRDDAATALLRHCDDTAAAVSYTHLTLPTICSV